MKLAIPRVLIAGAHSGCGKTTLTLGLVAALHRRGLKVQTFKVGPDYLDPTWLAAASGRKCYNLDGWMSDRDYVEALFVRAARDADLAVIEGVMGLFDGAEASGLAGSSAEMAAWLRAPVVLVVNAHGMARSIAPLVSGFSDFDKDVRICAVVANQCGSDSHRAILEEALASSSQPALIGAVPRQGFAKLDSRHLGLVAADAADNGAALDGFADAAERYLDLDPLLGIAREAPALTLPATDPASTPCHSQWTVQLAVARDEAFHFYYADLFDELARLGCRIVFFSPLRESSLPGGTDAVYLGGGYPEAHAEALSANGEMLASIRRFCRSGRPVYAECGGLVYLSKAVTTVAQQRYALVGVLDVETRMLERRKRLGYAEVVLEQDTLWGRRGDRLRGHTFHYSELFADQTARHGWSPAYALSPRRGRESQEEGFTHPHRRVLASYVHLHLASRTRALAHFLQTCVQKPPQRD